MAATSKSWSSIADAQINPDSPIDTALMTSIRDDLVHLREWLGAGFTAGAVQDHNHDGVNSALVPIGPNYLRNGSFEDGTAGWTLTAYTGGTLAVSTSVYIHGKQSLAITSTVLANGGGNALSDEYTPCGKGLGVQIVGMIKASAANVSSLIEFIWYDNAKAQISASTAYSSSSTPTTFTRVYKTISPPTNAAYVRIKTTGGVPATGTGTGVIYIDGLTLSDYLLAIPGTIALHTNQFSETTGGSTAFSYLIPRTGTYSIDWSLSGQAGNTTQGQVYKNGVAYGTLYSFNATTTIYHIEDLYFEEGDTAEFKSSHNGGGGFSQTSGMTVRQGQTLTNIYP